MSLKRVALLSALCATASVGLAGTASADPLNGPYHLVVTNGRGLLPSGSQDDVFASPCGSDCTHMSAPKWDADLHLAGNSWTGVASNGMTITLDSNSLAGTTSKPGYATMDVQLRA
jgi:hypothetical protein